MMQIATFTVLLWLAGCAVSFATTIEMWISAFIPKDVPGVTVPAPSGAGLSPGMTMVRAPGGYCYDTNQRAFSSAPSAESKIRSKAIIEIGNDGRATVITSHVSDETRLRRCDSGRLEEKAFADTKRMNWRREVDDQHQVVLFVQGQAANPLIKLLGIRLSDYIGSYVPGDIDYEGRFIITKAGPTVRFEGKVDDFPAFEAYYSINGGAPKALFTIGPKAGVAPFPGLIGYPERAVP